MRADRKQRAKRKAAETVYEIRMVVTSLGRPIRVDGIRELIAKSGGTAQCFNRRVGADGDPEYVVIFVLSKPEELTQIVAAVESVQGIAVIAVTDPKPVRTTKNGDSAGSSQG